MQCKLLYRNEHLKLTVSYERNRELPRHSNNQYFVKERIIRRKYYNISNNLVFRPKKFLTLMMRRDETNRSTTKLKIVLEVSFSNTDI